MSTTRVASVHYLPLKCERRYYPFKFEIPACTLGGDPQILILKDTMERDEGPVSSGPGGNRRQKLEYPVTGSEIANCVVNEWTRLVPGNSPICHPGVWVVRDYMPVMKILRDPSNPGDPGVEVAELDYAGKAIFREATPSEKQKMWEEDLRENLSADRAYADWAFGQGMTYKPEYIASIPEQYKVACRHYGIDIAWAKKGAVANVATCPHCEARISSRDVMICTHCTQVVNVEKWAQFQAKKDIELRDAKKELQAA